MVKERNEKRTPKQPVAKDVQSRAGTSAYKSSSAGSGQIPKRTKADKKSKAQDIAHQDDLADSVGSRLDHY